MIKKYMNQLYNEVMWYKKKIDSGKLKYFGKRDIGDDNCFIVILKDGSYFYVTIGTNNIKYTVKCQDAFSYDFSKQNINLSFSTKDEDI